MTPQEDRGAFEAALLAGELAHLLTIGSPERLAVRVTLGNLDRRGRFHEWRPDAFVIWRGCRCSVREMRSRMIEDAWVWLAHKLPRPLAYWATIRVGVHAASGRHSSQEVPALTLAQILQRWENEA